MISANISSAESADEQKIKETIIGFSKAGDQNNADLLATYLDENFRIVMNRLFGSNTVSIMPRSVYLEKIRIKEFGGDDREVTINQTVINGNCASVHATLVGGKMTMKTIFSLIKTGNGQWKLISDMPFIN